MCRFLPPWSETETTGEGEDEAVAGRQCPQSRRARSASEKTAGRGCAGVTETDCAVPGNGDDERDMRSNGGRGKPEDLNELALLEERLLILHHVGMRTNIDHAAEKQ